MGSIHVCLPEFTRFPVLVEQEVGGVFVVLMEVVLDAPLFGARDRDQLLKLGLDQIDLIGIGAERARTLAFDEPDPALAASLAQGQVGDRVVDARARAERPARRDRGAVVGIDHQGQAAVAGDAGELDRQHRTAGAPATVVRQAVRIPDQRAPAENGDLHDGAEGETRTPTRIPGLDPEYLKVVILTPLFFTSSTCNHLMIKPFVRFS